MSEDKLKIAVFIDFDNIEIGVKTTLSQHFDVGSVLEAIKERGEIVTKVAYGDWTRAGDYGRAMSQHAIHMVQRNLTPGGDKNGADINLALDALEMAFTHSHINSFVIVGGDSDFISLVEKLKQYDRKVFVVGGRAFTSVVMQKNCTEFLAYENLVGRGRPAPRGAKAASAGDLSQAMPLVKRALKLLADREAVPQLGLLKSTLLQLDSAFSERDYGAGSFRDFVQKLASAGYVTLKGSDRSFHVELREGPEAAAAPEKGTTGIEPRGAPPVQPAPPAPAGGDEPDEASAAAVAAPPRLPQADAVRVFQQAIAQARSPRWPMYVRQVKQLVKAVDPQFDERAYGFGGIIEALRHCQRDGLFRIERDRLGVVRVFPGPALQVQKPAEVTEAEADLQPAEAVEAAAGGAAETRGHAGAAPVEPLGAHGSLPAERPEPHEPAQPSLDAEADLESPPVADADAGARADAVGPAPGQATSRQPSRRRGRTGTTQPRARKTPTARKRPAQGAPARGRNRKPQE